MANANAQMQPNLTEEDLFPANRIIGGQAASMENWKFIVSINAGTISFCGGTLINENCIVTAAHCFTDKSKVTNLNVRAGSLNLHGSDGQQSNILSVAVYPQFDHKELLNDIAVVRVETPIKISDSVNYISLRTDGTKSGEVCRSAGWGRMEPMPNLFRGKKETYPSFLMEVELPVISYEECRNYYPAEQMLPNVICTLAHDGKDACRGDSGGPLICNNTLAGITSWGAGCAQPNKPGVWTEAVHFKSWVTQSCEYLQRSSSDEKPPGYKDEGHPHPMLPQQIKRGNNGKNCPIPNFTLVTCVCLIATTLSYM